MQKMREVDVLPRLGVNIDHVATLRQLRGTPYPSLLEAVDACGRGGAKQITVHLREDRRHIQDRDVFEIKKHLPRTMQLNLEMALSEEIIGIAMKLKPDWVCLVPEKRREVTTEGGLDLFRAKKKLEKLIPSFHKRKIKVSLFIEPDPKIIKLAHIMRADAIELHTGRYAIADQQKKKTVRQRELKRILEAARLGNSLGLSVHAGHGLDDQNVRDLAFGTGIQEFNIGHFLVCRSVQIGLERAVKEMMAAIQAP